MRIEVLISTMHQSSMHIFDAMNIKSDALAVNQCNYEYYEESTNNNDDVHRMISINERGLSNSRNLATRNSSADICVLADEDVVYKDNYADIIADAYKKHPDADIIAFSVRSSNKELPVNILKHMKVNALQSMKLCSVQLTFRRESITNNKISFNTLFGAGSIFTCGEENIFLIECLKKGLKIIYVDDEIAVVNQKGSTWFKGFDTLYFKTKGAMFYEMSRMLWLLLIFQFAVRKYKLYQSSISLLAALKYMFIGRLEYKSFLLKGKVDMNQIQLIPKTIHYFWFGRKPKSELINKCISSWKKYSPDYEILEWNEDNFDVFSNRYSQEAYENGRYAFVSDFARLKVLFEYGGFYLDTDVELLKPLDDLRNQEAFMGFETDFTVGPGSIIGAQSRNAFIGELLNKYSTLRFTYNGHLNLTPIGEYTTALLLKKGLKLNGQYQRLAGINIYPRKVFCPYDFFTGSFDITVDTYSIHYFNGSWMENPNLGNLKSKLLPLTIKAKLLLLSIAGERNFFRIKYFWR